MGNAYKILFGNPEEKRPHRKPKGGWVVILKWIFKSWMECCGPNSFCSG
jgi:hypothetical protein